MAVTINSNSAARIAAYDLSRANDALRHSLARLSSGFRIVDSRDDPGGMSVAYKLNSRLSRTEAVRTNVQNAISYLQVQDGALTSAGRVVSRMSELRAMAQDVTKNSSDIENYTKEFIELQRHLSQLYREKFNGVSLFAISGSSQVLPPVSPTLNKGSFVDQLGFNKTMFSRRLYTHDSGQAGDGNVSIGVINFEDVFNLGTLDSRYVKVFQGDSPNLSNADQINLAFDVPDPMLTKPQNAPEGSAYVDMVKGVNNLRIYSKETPQTEGNLWRVIIDDNTGLADDSFIQIPPGETVEGVNNPSDSETHFVFQLKESFSSYDPGFLESINNSGDYFAVSLSHSGGTAADYFNSGSTTERTFSNGYIPSGYSEVFTEDGYLSSILFVSMSQFTSVIENIADARAENGAEQNRLLMVDDLLTSNMTNLEAAHGRIMDADVALESTRFAQQNVLVQAAASMVAQANQLSSIALTVLGR
jgi:flagellin-like hook-associated protein FlgL